MPYTYRAAALRSDPATASWRLRDGFDPQSDRLSVHFAEQGLAGDAALGGGDGDPLAEVSNFRGQIVASGPARLIPHTRLARAGGRVIGLMRLTVAGAHTGWVASEPLAAGVDYREVSASTSTPDPEAGPPPTATSAANPAGLGGGTMIATDDGEQAIDWLRPGDHLLTRDHGYQPILWIGRVQRPAQPAADTAADGVAVVEIAADTFGRSIPARVLRMTGALGLLLHSPDFKLHFGEAEMLAEAQDLIDTERIRPVEPEPDFVFYQILLPEPEVILAEGMWVASMFASIETLGAETLPMRHLLQSLTMGRHARAARPSLARSEWEAAMFDLPGIMRRWRRAA